MVFSSTASVGALSLFSDEQEGLLTGIIVNGLLCIRDIHGSRRGHERLARQRDCYCERRRGRPKGQSGERAREKKRERGSSLALTILFGSSPATHDVTL